MIVYILDMSVLPKQDIEFYSNFIGQISGWM